MRVFKKIFPIAFILIFASPVYATTDPWTSQSLNNYAVMLQPEGGYAGVTTRQDVEYDKTSGNSVMVPRKAGYTFNGYYDNNGNIIYSASGAASDGLYWENGKWKKKDDSGRSITAYAKWTANTYTIRYSSNGGTGSVSEQVANYGTQIALQANAFVRNNYKFAGWGTQVDGGTIYQPGTKVSSLAGRNPGESITLYAQWKRSGAIVHFDANGGKGTMPDMTVSLNDTAIMPKCNFTKRTSNGESTFIGWALNKDKFQGVYSSNSTADTMEGIYPEGSSLAIYENMTLYAMWDDYPSFAGIELEFPNRFFNLEEAKAGFITEEKLLSTVRVISNGQELKKYLRKDYVAGPGVILLDYDEDEFKRIANPCAMSIRYKAEDYSGRTIYLDAYVYVTNTKRNLSDFSIRSISNRYYDKSRGAGLSAVWYNDKKDLINNALSPNSSIVRYRLSPGDIKFFKENAMTTEQKQNYLYSKTN